MRHDYLKSQIRRSERSTARTSRPVLFLVAFAFFSVNSAAQNSRVNTAVSSPSDYLIAHLPLDGNVIEILSGATPNIIAGTSATDGRVDQALHFDGMSYVQLPIDVSPEAVPEMTITLWVRPDRLPEDTEQRKAFYPNAYLLSDGDGLLMINNQQNDIPYFEAYSTGNAVRNSSHPAMRGGWQLLALTRKIENRTTAKGEVIPHTILMLYSNGRVSERAAPHKRQTIAPYISLGALSQGRSGKFRGAIDDIRIYARTLSTEEIRNLGSAQTGNSGRTAASPDPDGSPSDGSITTYGGPMEIGIDAESVAPAGLSRSEQAAANEAVFGDEGSADDDLPDRFGQPPSAAEILAGVEDDAARQSALENAAIDGRALPDAVAVPGTDGSALGGGASLDLPNVNTGLVDGSSESPGGPLNSLEGPAVDSPDLTAPDPGGQEVSGRIDEAQNNAKGADWRIDDVTLLSPAQVLPGSDIVLRVKVSKDDPLNLIPDVAVGVTDADGRVPVNIVTTTASPVGNAEVDVNWQLLQVSVPPVGEHGKAPIQISLYERGGPALADTDPGNNARMISIDILSPSVELCGQIEFFDFRRAKDSESVLSSSNQSRGLGGLYFEALQMIGSCRDGADKCSERDDRSLGKRVSALYDSRSGVGHYCVVADRPATVYLRTSYETRIARTIDASDRPPEIFSPPVKLALDDDSPVFDWNVSCPDIEASQCVESSKSRYAQTFGWSNTMATMADVDRAYKGAEVLTKIDVAVEPDRHPDCDDVFTRNPPQNQARESKMICIATPDNNHRVAHEVGHIVMNRALKLGSAGASVCENGSGWATEDNEKCATAEGFANFFAAAVYYDQDAASPEYNTDGRELEGPTDWGNNATPLDCVGEKGNPHQIEGNAARFFWDLYDSTNEGLDRGGSGDDTTMTLDEIVAGWRGFDAGTGDRQNREGGKAGDNDLNPNGRNAWDYTCQVPGAQSELKRNCLAAQEGAIGNVSCSK